MSDRETIGLKSLIVHLLHRAVQEADAVFMQHVGEDGPTPRQFAVLHTVAKKPNASQTRLAEMTGIDRSTLADLVRRLVRQGLLQRRRTKRDARAYAIRLSEKGRETLRVASPAARRADAVILSLLPAKQRNDVLTGLQTLVSALNERAEGAAGDLPPWILRKNPKSP